MGDAWAWLQGCNGTIPELEFMYKWAGDGQEKLTFEEYCQWWQNSRAFRIDDFIISEKAAVGILSLENTNTPEPEIKLHIKDELFDRVARYTLECGIIRATSSVKGIKKLKAHPKDREIPFYETFGFHTDGEVWFLDVQERTPPPPGSVQFSLPQILKKKRGK